MTFKYINYDEWLMTKPFTSLLDQGKKEKMIWDAAIAAERDRCKEKCEELMTQTDQPYDNYQNSYNDGWIAACNECKWVISGCVPTNQVYTAEELSKVASIGKAYFENNKPIDIQIMGPDDKYS